MTSNFTKIRKYFGWVLIIVSIILSILGIVVAAMGELVKGGAIYVASQVTWYPGLALLGPEIVQKSKEIWNNLILKVRGFFK
ncbi:MAG TPA: hypothetical protein QGF66_03615 [SAR86 cluster bacterium]|jgi:uncharacterized membrane protein|nr:hypothetical protein [SAR86 cluster bacterium]HJM15452.1 hypothetical protein [SAR86 cluster bacterium]|tara:strand:- start:1085 stop:1330 length:246 start_codon:yes stop_codon:yes gene_type:complete